MQPNIILTGFMGTGKTSIGRYVARQMGRPFVDLDDVIAKRAGKPIPRIFAEDGEPAFRALEAAICAELREPSGLVVATGGGAVVNAANREALAAGGIVICLDADPQVILARVGNGSDRPMLAGEDRLARIKALLAQRATAYAAIPHHLDTTHLSIPAAAERVMGIVAGLPEGGHRLIVDCRLRIADYQSMEGQPAVRNPKSEIPNFRSAVPNPQSEIQPYSVLIARGLLAQAGRRMVEAGVRPGRCAVVTNPTVGRYYAAALAASLADAGFEPLVFEVPDGEAHKALATVAGLYERFAAAGLARREPIIALGGGVIGDMAGFAAATWLRGVPFVQIPTSLLAIVDASVGGKVGVDLPQGKNLVGAFKQPELVLIDPALLDTLPPAEFRCGLAEIIKAGIIGDPELFERLASGDDALSVLSESRREPAKAFSPNAHYAALTEIIAAAVRVKADIVQRDPFEAGDRAWLNLGHTFGHALELVSGFTLPHGEAVGVGLIAAAELSARLGLCAADLPNRIRRAVERHGLPTRFPCNPADVLAAMGTDKKRRGRNLRFVVIRDIGRVEVVEDVPMKAVLEAAATIAGPPAE
ncbi:MAG: 3-dehydroquinate synthase [Anaerolineae bacterium]|nr:3-dehydroquinate synthase [Anaerolineae bacterium]